MIVVPGATVPEYVIQNVERLRQPVPTALWAEPKAEGLLREDAPTPVE